MTFSLKETDHNSEFFKQQWKEFMRKAIEAAGSVENLCEAIGVDRCNLNRHCIDRIYEFIEHGIVQD